MQKHYSDLEVAFRRYDGSSYSVDFRFHCYGDAVERRWTAESVIALDVLALAGDDPQAYAEILTAAFFTPEVREGFRGFRAAAATANSILRVRLSIDANASELHAIRWEMLRDPDELAGSDGAHLFAGEQTLLSRFLNSRSDWQLVELRPKGKLRALAVVANPRFSLEKYRLAPINSDVEIKLARESMGGIDVTQFEPGGAVSLEALGASLRRGFDILYLVCHGIHDDQGPRLYLDEGQPNSGLDLVRAIKELNQRPHLVVLVSCESAGKDGVVLAGLGPMLAEAGVPAVIAMQGDISMKTAAVFMRTFFFELRQDGRIDRAMAAARGDVRNADDYWMPVLFMSLRDGRIWRDPESDGEISGLDPFATVPPLPANFIERPEVSEPLIESLLTNDSTVGLTALEGMGGVGKSVAALGLCHNPRIRDAFPDGIVWLPIGRQSGITLSQRVETIASALNQRFRSYDEAAYRSLLSKKAALIVLDDVWTLDAAEPFLPPPGRSRLLYTSRNRDIAGPLGAESQEIGTLELADARRFLLRWSGRDRRLPPERHIDDILAECDGLVLALAMIGARLRGQDDREWAVVAADLRKAQPKLISGRPSRYEHPTLHSSIAVSVDALEPTAKEAYLRLAVLLEDMAAPEVLLQALWGGDLDEVHRLARLLFDRSLAARDAEGALHLHDLQLDYLQAEHPDRAALEIIHAALLRSLHVIERSPEQFSSQMTGRLLPHAAASGIALFLRELDERSPLPRLRPLRSALQPAGARVLEGHAWSVTAVALSADGRRAVSGSGDKTLRVWELDGGLSSRVLEGHSGLVYSVALSADGRRAVSGSDDKTVRVWELDGGGPPRVLEGHSDVVVAVAVSADGRRVVSGSHDGTVRVWDLDDGGLPRVLEGHSDQVTAVAVSADGRRAISGSPDHTVRMWDLDGNGRPVELEGHSGYVSAVALSADGRRAISGSHDHTARVWQLDGSGPPIELYGHNGSVLAVALSADGRRAVSGSYDETVRVWELDSGGPPQVLEGHSGVVVAVAVSADGRRAVSGSHDRTVRVWDLISGESPRVAEDHSDRVRAVALSANGRRAVSGSKDGRVRVWDLDSGSPRVLEGYFWSVRSVALSADGRRAVSGSEDGKLRVWELDSGGLPVELEGHHGSIHGVALSADGRRVVSASSDKLRVWELDLGGPPRVLEGHTEYVYAIALSADGRRAVSGSGDNTVRVWELDAGGPPRVLEGHTEYVYAVALSADGRRAVSGSDDNTVRVWELDADGRSRVLEGHTGLVCAVALSADGRRAVSASLDKTVRVWDVDTFGCLFVLTCDVALDSCSWGGGRIAVGDWGGHLHLFRWEE